MRHSRRRACEVLDRHAGGRLNRPVRLWRTSDSVVRILTIRRHDVNAQPDHGRGRDCQHAHTPTGAQSQHRPPARSEQLAQVASAGGHGRRSGRLPASPEPSHHPRQARREARSPRPAPASCGRDRATSASPAILDRGLVEHEVAALQHAAGRRRNRRGWHPSAATARASSRCARRNMSPSASATAHARPAARTSAARSLQPGESGAVGEDVRQRLASIGHGA